jgi:hypothetical protein
MYEPGLDRHEWESVWESLDEAIRDDPVDALSELDMFIHRMLEESGYDVDDPVARPGEEREVVTDFLAAHEIKVAVDRGADGISPGDVAMAINNYREIYEYLLTNRSATDGELATRELEHPEET